MSEQKAARDRRASFSGSVALFCLAIVVYLIFRWVLFEPFVIPSGSMIPTLLVNDHIIVKKFAYGVRVPFTKKWLTGPYVPKRGDVVVFRSVDQEDYYLIKRVVGLPGDRVEYTEAGELKINGQPVIDKEMPTPSDWTSADIQEPVSNIRAFRERLGVHKHWEILERGDYHYPQPEIVVPAGELFAMGDNRDRSRDSRYWGEFPLKNLIGRATWVWLGCSVTLSQVDFLCDPRYIRWHGLIHQIE